MKAVYIDYRQTGSFSKTFLAYLEKDPQLKPFVSDWPTLEAFARQIERRRAAFREGDGHKCLDLVEVLQEQYGALLDEASLVSSNIDALAQGNQRTFTVTTGHQLNIFTGPLYFIYKIASTIRLAQDLKAAYPEYNFVPVYWMATEDHDFAEINHTYVLDKRIAWEAESHTATGRLSTTSIRQALQAYKQILGLGPQALALGQLMEEAYGKHEKLADATRYLVHQLFASFGLVIVDADDARLKKHLANYIKRDVLEGCSNQAVQASNETLQELGFQPQVHSRPINFFYLTDEYRERLEQKGSRVLVLNRDVSFDAAAFEAEVDQHPERFSPNVVMRPLYQEVLLPNLAYVGGGAEIAYWLQLKAAFDRFEVPFPLLIPRNSALLAPESLAGKLQRMDLKLEELFLPLEELKKLYVRRHTERELDLDADWKKMEVLMQDVKAKAARVDPTLQPSVEAVQARFQKALGNLEKKFMRAEKRRYTEALLQIERLKQSYFPQGGLQERRENFAVFYLTHGPKLIEHLIQSFKPLDFQFTILLSQKS